MEGSKEGTEGPSYLVRGGLEGRGQKLIARRGKKEFPPKKNGGYTSLQKFYMHKNR